MSEEGTTHRRLAAIMFTDMVGYSALALELLEEHRRLLRPFFRKHQGTEVKTMGDGFLVDFASALGAVRCAIEIQENMGQRNAAVSPEKVVRIRIDIHLGDVVRREQDVYGDGVNIAARIEPLAEPGGICVSQQIYDHVQNKIEHSLIKFGVGELLIDGMNAGGRATKLPVSVAKESSPTCGPPIFGVKTKSRRIGNSEYRFFHGTAAKLGLLGRNGD